MTNPTYTVLLDIDNVVACDSYTDIEQVKFYYLRGRIIKAITTHYLFPGAIELITFLYLAENVKFAFFSAGAHERNKPFVRKVSQYAFAGQDDKIQKIRVFSGHHLKTTHEQARENCWKQYGVYLGRKHKDILCGLKEGDDIKNAVLWDNSLTVAAPDQVKNLLYVPSTNSQHFSNLATKISSYDSLGFKYLKCAFASTKNKKWNELEAKVKGRTQLLIVQQDEGFEIHFIDEQSRAYKKKLLTKEENSALIAALNQSYPGLLKRDSSVVWPIDDKNLLKKVYDFVCTYGGISQKICRQANRIYYAAGLFFTALKKARKEGLPLCEALFQLQFEKKDDGSFVRKFRELSKMDGLYLLGLKKLRQINPQLNLNTPHDYVACLKRSLAKKNGKN